MKRYALKMYPATKIVHFDGYAVDSEIVTGLTHLSDGQNHGLLRAKEAMTWPKEEDDQVIGRMVPEVRREAAADGHSSCYGRTMGIGGENDKF